MYKNQQVAVGDEEREPTAKELKLVLVEEPELELLFLYSPWNAENSVMADKSCGPFRERSRGGGFTLKHVVSLIRKNAPRECTEAATDIVFNGDSRPPQIILEFQPES